ncbi:MAG: DUF2141 domain-containing protein [Flavobacteriales bacterium]|nr:DUF2141 domain-containing protein [Flavobacteriales bacterium]
MRCVLLIGLLVACASEIHAQSNAILEIVLSRPDAGGTVRIAICPDEASYDKEKGCIVRSASASGAVVRVPLTGIATGTYGIKIFHDVNDNGVLDTNWIGIPTEPYGFSNDAMGTFGPPGFKEAAVEFGVPNAVIRIRMKG